MKKKQTFLKIVIVMMALFFITMKTNQFNVNAAVDWSSVKTNEITLFIGEAWAFNMSYSTNYLASQNRGTIYDKNGNSSTAEKAAGNSKNIREHATAKISDKTCTVKGTSAGNNYFFIFKKDGKPSRRIHVKVMQKPNIISVTNQYQNVGTSKSSNVYLYTGESATATVNTTGTVGSRTWTAQTSYGGSTSGITISSQTSTTCRINAVKSGTYKINVTVKTVSTMSNVTITKTIYVYVYNKPELYVYHNGSSVTSKQIYINHEANFTMQLKNINSTDITSNAKCVSQDATKFTTKTSNGVFTIVPLNITNGVGVNALFSINLSSNVTKNNDSGGVRTFTRPVTITIKNDPVIYVTEVYFNDFEYVIEEGKKKSIKANVFPTNATNKDLIYSSSDGTIASVDNTGMVTARRSGIVTITVISTDGTNIKGSYKLSVREKTPGVPKGIEIRNKKKSIKLNWWNVSGAKTYEVYRSKYSNKGFVRIAITEENYYSDTSAKYNKAYYYKICAVSPNGYKSVFSPAKYMKHIIKSPSIKSIKKVKDGFKISIKGDKYDGFAVYIGKNKKPKKFVTLLSGEKANIYYRFIKKKKYYVRIRAYKKNGQKFTYSAYSKVKIIK